MLENNLQNLGMSEKEAKVYLALLEVDYASATELSRKTGIKRPTVYVVIESLAEKGLVSETTVGKRTRFQAESPERLETYVERRKQELNEQSKELKSEIIPQLRGLRHAKADEPIIKFYSGKEGALIALEELIKGYDRSSSDNKESIAYLAFPRDLLEKHFNEEDRNRYRQMRLDKKIETRAIYTYTLGDLPPTKLGKHTRIDDEKYPILCDLSIFHDRAQINTLGENVSGISIHSRDVAVTLRSLIQYVFDTEEEKKGEA